MGRRRDIDSIIDCAADSAVDSATERIVDKTIDSIIGEIVGGILGSKASTPCREAELYPVVQVPHPRQTRGNDAVWTGIETAGYPVFCPDGGYQ